MKGGIYPGVSRFTDKSGRVRYRYRKTGHRARMMQEDFGTPEFDREYQMCLHITAARRRTKPSNNRWRVKPPQSDAEGFVYFIGGASGPIKIGFSCDPSQRLRTISKHHPEELSILGAVRGTPLLEFTIHQEWAPLRIRGEWFQRTPELERVIEEISDGKL